MYMNVYGALFHGGWNQKSFDQVGRDTYMEQKQIRTINWLKIKAIDQRFQIMYPLFIGYKLVKVLYKIFRACILFMTDRIYRSDQLTKIRYGKQVLQPNSYTCLNRYVDLFTICQQYLLNLPNQVNATKLSSDSKIIPLDVFIRYKVLSFGCSIGDEIVSLQHYLPRAQLVGVDINYYN